MNWRHLVIPISKPLLGEEEQAAVRRVIESGMLAQGPRVAEFERAFAEFIGVNKAIMPVHLYGQPADLGVLDQIARQNGLALIEDACQAHGAEFAGRKAGSYGSGCFSFYATKNMTTGEGGMITTDNEGIAQRARM